MSRDRWLICAVAGLRAIAVGLCGVIFALYLSAQGFRADAIGLVITLGLSGCAAATWMVTYTADHHGRRRSLIVLALLMALGGLMLAWVSHPTLILVSAFLGMLNGMGRDRGAGLTIEQAILPQTTTPRNRTNAFAWYNLIIDAGHAIGALLGGLPAYLRLHASVSPSYSYQCTWLVYSVCCLMAMLLTLRLSPAVERSGQARHVTLSAASRPMVMKFAALSGLDSFAGGFLTTALLGYWFFKRFGVDEALLGPLFFIVRIANGLSHLGAAWIARRIGLVNTMVFTHVPSSLLLMTVPLAPSLPVAVILFVIRESLVEMDVPTRQSYLMAVVREEERVQAGGITNLTRSVAWASAPALAGVLMRSISLSAPLVIGPGLKVAYDLLLYRAFRRLKPPEEHDGGIHRQT